ncbi:MAG: acyl-CoA dehydrogenase family protein [Acidocella sp.]|nr:acyl-CoA dehydrogenase family protein [Acidocella sp.]
MDFDFTDDQKLLKESVGKLMASRYGDFEKRKGYQKYPNGYDPAVWAEYAEAGILSLPFSEAQGGFGGGPVETMIVMEEMGTALAVEPYLACVVLAGAILKYGKADHKIADIVSGEAIIALANIERGSRYDLNDVSMPAKLDGTEYVLEGEKSVVLGGGAADYFIVAARTSGNRRDVDGITLLLVDAKSAGISRRGYPTQDGQHAAEVSFGSVRVPVSNVIGGVGKGYAILTRAVDEAIAGLCAEAVGAMDALVKMTVEYLKTRKQFGVAIGSFQALQHRSVDMLVMLEQARSMAIYAALCVDDADEVARGNAISAAKVQIGRSAKFIGQQSVQLHGGIGVTMEYKAGHYFKRLTMIEQMFGDSDYHLRKLAASVAGLAA